MKSTTKKDPNYFADEIGEKATRKLKALGESKRSVWFGLGMFGNYRLDGCSSYFARSCIGDMDG